MRTGGFLYVDKTRFIYQLVQGAGFYFLSRPRRFGKSLLASTLKYLFQGRKDLFEGLWIADHYDWTQKHPVLLISFTTVPYREEGLPKGLSDTLDRIAAENSISLAQSSAQGKFLELILSMSAAGPVVVLIDEYDKPILDYLDDQPQATANRDFLRGFYGILKDTALAPHLRLVFLTGVSKFSKVSVFSELNNLSDLTMHPAYATLLGITQEELERDFSPFIDRLAESEAILRGAILKKMKTWYNGYSWDGVHFVYNPFSLLNLFDTYKFDNYWFSSGTPSFLIKTIKNRAEPLEHLDELEVPNEFFQKFDIETPDLHALMFQTGYLTIKHKTRLGETELYSLGYPNQEVQHAFNYHLLEGFADKSLGKVSDMVIKIQRALLKNDLETFIAQLRAIFADIDYHLQPREQKSPTQADAMWEGYFHSLTYLLLSLIGINIRTEVSKHKGRMDALIQTDQYIYIIEFKIGNAWEALEQIKKSDYAAAYAGQGKSVVLLAIGFDKTEKNVQDWLSEMC